MPSSLTSIFRTSTTSTRKQKYQSTILIIHCNGFDQILHIIPETGQIEEFRGSGMGFTKFSQNGTHERSRESLGHVSLQSALHGQSQDHFDDQGMTMRSRFLLQVKDEIKLVLDQLDRSSHRGIFDVEKILRNVAQSAVSACGCLPEDSEKGGGEEESLAELILVHVDRPTPGKIGYDRSGEPRTIKRWF